MTNRRERATEFITGKGQLLQNDQKVADVTYRVQLWEFWLEQESLDSNEPVSKSEPDIRGAGIVTVIQDFSFFEPGGYQLVDQSGQNFNVVLSSRSKESDIYDVSLADARNLK